MTRWTYPELCCLGDCIDRGLSGGQAVRHFKGRSRSSLTIQANRQGWHFGQARLDRTVTPPAPAAMKIARCDIHLNVSPEAKDLLWTCSQAAGVTMSQFADSLILAQKVESDV